jgi:murein DD-endopeptidase MepM/ murein hydrolase activator NlpD
MSRRRYLLLMILIVFAISFSNVMAEDTNKKLCTKFFAPFNEPERHKYLSIVNRCFSEYGEYRSSTIKGHKHAGIDLRGKLSENVYPIGIGKVYDILWGFPNLAIAIIHPLSNGEYVYSLYIHIENIQVKVGDWVDENTVIAKLFNPEEFKKSQFQTVHLHLEIRKSMEDEGRASYTSMTMNDLNRYCMNPKEFLRKQLE